MENDKIIVLVLLIVIAALVVGLGFTMSGANKTDTVLSFKSDSKLSEGGMLEIALSDENGTAVANKTVNIHITGENVPSEDYSVITDNNGIGFLELDLGPGDYNVTVGFAGSDKYAPCSADEKLTIEKQPEIFNDTYVEKREGNLVYGYKEGRYGFWTPSGNFIEDKSRALSGQDPSEPFTRDGDFYSQL